MPTQTEKPTRWVWFSPWMIIGSVCILAGILLVLAAKNINREKQFMMRSLLTEANMLISSLEASSRTGMMGMGWGQRQLQLLLEQTAQQPDILYVRIVTSQGEVLVDSQNERPGSTLSFVPPQPGQIIQRFVDDGARSFEVIRSFQPWQRLKGRHSRNMPCPIGSQRTDNDDLFIMVGLDPTPFEQARQQDLQQSILLFGIIFLVGAAGIISLVWAQHYRLARSSLSDMRAFTSTLVGQMPVGLIVIDQNENIQTTNEAAKKILKAAHLGGKISKFPSFDAIAKQLKHEETVLEQELHCRTEQGESVPLLLNASIIRDGEQRTAGYVFLFTDITQIKQLEEQLRRSERLAALGRLAAGVAHEIRNPLSSIKGFAAILAGKFEGDDSRRKIAEVMGQEVERLNRVVTELLDFARPTELNKEVHFCRDLIQRTLRLVEKDALQQKVVIEARVDPQALQVEVDQDRFSQLLLNLYLNALQAMEDGGTLTIEAFRQSDQVVFQVTDSGNGISSEHLPHIFDPYFTTKPHGVGLGLANVHKLVEAHGGDIEAVSSSGKGTTIIIKLPSMDNPSEIADAIRSDGEVKRGSTPRASAFLG